MPKNTPTESKCGCDCIFCEENNHCFRIMCNPLVARKKEAVKIGEDPLAYASGNGNGEIRTDGTTPRLEPHIEGEESWEKEIEKICVENDIWWVDEDGEKINVGNNLDFMEAIHHIRDEAYQKGREDETDNCSDHIGIDTIRTDTLDRVVEKINEIKNEAEKGEMKIVDIFTALLTKITSMREGKS